MTDTRSSNNHNNNSNEKLTGDKSKTASPATQSQQLQQLQPIAPYSINAAEVRKSPSPSPSPSASNALATNNNRSVPPTKRRKVSIACHECRTHKTKCDGAQPICGSCRKRKLPESACAYSPERGKRGVKNQ